MRADTEVTQWDDRSDPVVIIREDDGTPIMFVLVRWEYKESEAEAIRRSQRIAEFLTNHGTVRGWRDRD